MKVLSYFIKTFKENIRDWKILVLALVFAPFFVFLMYFYLNGSGTPAYTVAILNQDRGAYSGELIGEYKKNRNADGKPVLSIVAVSDQNTGRTMVRNRSAELFVTIPPDFSGSLECFLKTRAGSVSSLTSYYDPSNMKYVMPASLCDYTAYTYIGARTGTAVPFSVTFEAAGPGRALGEFDLYFPALLVFSLIMVLFTAAASLVREVEKGTMARLILSKLSAAEFLGAVSLNQVIVGAACLALTFLAGVSVGYRTSGSLSLLLLVGVVTCFSVIAISIITACFIRTIFGLLTVGCFPFFILMFFSDCFMPLPKINLFMIAGNQVYLNDILPTAIATRAFNKILNYNAGFGDIAFELAAIVFLSMVYFTVGVLLFKRKHIDNYTM